MISSSSSSSSSSSYYYYYYYCHINKYEILGEFLCQNMISSHVKIRCLDQFKDHCFHGYIINHPLCRKTTFK